MLTTNSQGHQRKDDGKDIRNTRRMGLKPTQCNEIKNGMGNMEEDALSSTTKNTTQFFMNDVEQERQSLPRNHRHKRLRALCHHRTPGKTCTDTVHSSTTSARKHNCFQLFCAKRSGKLKCYLIERESHVPKAMESFLTDQGSPLFLQSDNAKVMKSENMVKMMLREKIKQKFTEPHYQNQT